MAMPPWPLRAMVLAHDPDNDAMTVVLASGQMPTYVVKRMYHGYVDSHRISKQPLPVRGSWGLVVFPGGDIRNGLWVGAYQPHKIDAITSEQADPFADYHSHFSGHWSLLHGVSGHCATQFADGSYVVASSGSDLPTTYRHIVDDQQQRQRKEFPFSDRNPNPQPTFAYTFVQSGTEFSGALTSKGSLTVTFAKGQTLTVQQSGTGATWTIDGTGNITFNAATDNGTVFISGPKQITMKTKILEVDASDHVTVNSPTATFSGDIHANGAIIAGYGGGDSVGLQTHTHTQGNDSHNDGEVPTNSPTGGT